MFKNDPVIKLPLPQPFFHSKFNEFNAASLKQKGILKEMFFGLWTRKTYGNEAKWMADPSSVADICLYRREFIDHKSTSKNTYNFLRTERALEFLRNNNKDFIFTFILTDIEQWNLDTSEIVIRVHEINTYRTDGSCAKSYPLGSYKRFKQEK